MPTPAILLLQISGFPGYRKVGMSLSSARVRFDRASPRGSGQRRQRRCTSFACSKFLEGDSAEGPVSADHLTKNSHRQNYCQCLPSGRQGVRHHRGSRRLHDHHTAKGAQRDSRVCWFLYARWWVLPPHSFLESSQLPQGSLLLFHGGNTVLKLYIIIVNARSRKHASQRPH